MDNKIKLVIVGLGNCASSLVQGLDYYKDSRNSEQRVPGLMHNVIGEYGIDSIEVVGAYDVNTDKIGKAVKDAIWVEPNCTKKFSDSTCETIVRQGPILDGLSPRMLQRFGHAEPEFEYHVMRNPNVTIETLLETNPTLNARFDEIVEEVKAMGAEVLISYMPVGSALATRFWAHVCLEAKIAFVNAIPEFVCSTPEYANKFQAAGIPCAGDDIKSQVGATIVHRVLAALVDDRGQTIDDTFQLNVGGNTDFENMIDEERLTSKRISKTEAVTSQSDQKFSTKIGPSDYVAHLKDNKVCYINLRGRQFGDIPFDIDLKLSVEDSPNSAGCMIDVIRLLKLARDRGDAGYQEFSSYFFKHPMYQHRDNECRDIVNMFIDGIYVGTVGKK